MPHQPIASGLANPTCLTETRQQGIARILPEARRLLRERHPTTPARLIEDMAPTLAVLLWDDERRIAYRANRAATLDGEPITKRLADCHRDLARAA